MRDQLPLVPAGAIMGFAGLPWACWTAAPANYGCWRPNTFLAPGASVWLSAYAWVPGSYPHCHLQNDALITWAPGGSVWNTVLVDDFDSAVATIPAPHCPPSGISTNLMLEKSTTNNGACTKTGGYFICSYRINVTNSGPGVYSGNLVVREEPKVGTILAIGGFGWACASLGTSYDCTRNLPAFYPSQITTLAVFISVTQTEAEANNCKIRNTARIMFAPGGSPQNTIATDDADDALATIDKSICYEEVPSEQQPHDKSCPAGFVLKDDECKRRQGGSLPVPPAIVPRPSPQPDPEFTPSPSPELPKICPKGMRGKWPNCYAPQKPKVCPEGTIGRWPNCSKPETPRICPPGTIGIPPKCRPLSVNPNRARSWNINPEKLLKNPSLGAGNEVR